MLELIRGYTELTPYLTTDLGALYNGVRKLGCYEL